MNGLPPIGRDWSIRSPISHLVNGGFSAHASNAIGWTSTGDVTVSVVSGKLRVNASVADKGVYQALTGLEANALYSLACKVNTGGNEARIYTTQGSHNVDETVKSASEVTWAGQCLSSATGTLTVYLTAHTTGVNIEFDDVRLFRGNLVFPFVDSVHGITAADHTVTGDAMQVVGLTAANTLGLLTPSSDGYNAAAAALLRYDADGGTRLDHLEVGNVTGAVEGQLLARSAAYPVAEFARTSAVTNATRGVARFRHVTTGDMVDGFGPAIYFIIEDNTSGDQEIGYVSAVRAGADNAGDISFAPRAAGGYVHYTRVYGAGGMDTTGFFSAGTHIVADGLNNATCLLRMRTLTLADEGIDRIGYIDKPIAFVLIHDGSARGAIYTLRGGINAVDEVADPQTAYSAAKGTAGQTNIYYDAANARYEIQNRRGASQAYRMWFLTT